MYESHNMTVFANGPHNILYTVHYDTICRTFEAHSGCHTGSINYFQHRPMTLLLEDSK